MTQVNFYTLSQDEPDARVQFVCRLTEKARELGHHIYIHTQNEAQAKLLDELLWQFKPSSFIPHQRLTGEMAPETAVSISTQAAPAVCNDVLINLADKACENHQHFARINEIIGADIDSIQSGRERYRYYRDAGATLDTFKV